MDSWTAFVSGLEALGLFKYTNPDNLDEVREAIVRRRSLFEANGYSELMGRVFAGDAERLAEGGVLAFLFEIAPFLHSQGMSGMVYLDQEYHPDYHVYVVKVNLDEYVMLAEEELGQVISWSAIPARTFAMINKLLEGAGSKERVYSTRGSIAESSLAILLTPELYDAIRSSELLSDDENLLTVDELMEMF